MKQTQSEVIFMIGYDIEKVLETFQIVIDTREQSNKRAERRYLQFDVPYKKSALSVGDYCYDAVLPSGKHIIECGTKAITPLTAIERKMDLNELVGCFVSKKKEQFKNELERAKIAGTKMYLLVEDASWEDIYNHRYRSQMEPDTLLGYLIAYKVRYNMPIIFITAVNSGRLIEEILYRDLKERLSNGEFDEPLV